LIFHLTQKRRKTMAEDPKDLTKKRPFLAQIPVRVWNCDDLKEMISKQIRAHVKDVELAKKLEHSLGDEVAYGDGGGGGVGVA
jgi:hypothetical protein